MFAAFWQNFSRVAEIQSQRLFLVWFKNIFLQNNPRRLLLLAIPFHWLNEHKIAPQIYTGRYPATTTASSDGVPLCCQTEPEINANFQTRFSAKLSRSALFLSEKQSTTINGLSSFMLMLATEGTPSQLQKINLNF